MNRRSGSAEPYKHLLFFAATVLLQGCSPSQSSPEHSGKDYRALEAILGSCASSQSSVATALEGADTQVLLSTLDSAHQSCSLAASQLRETPIPTVHSDEVAKAIDQMDSGLVQITGAVKIMDRSPKKARNQAQAGMATYKAGLNSLRVASR